MSQTSSDTTLPPSLAEQALANLVNQFARPLDFLRELAQNSIDAGSPRIEVAVAWEAPKQPGVDGVLRIHVDDFGDGMDEDIIDNQLTRLFSSTKEDDLTKIGKFGIGFTSIFAIQPEAVLLRTGRHGEYWELVFHADRSFDKVRVEEPSQGTSVTLFKRLAPERLEAFVQEVRFVLGYWCEHSDTPLTFEDRTGGEVTPSSASDDPFAAFEQAQASGPERINRPLSLEAELEVQHVEDTLEVAIGCARPPRYGYYNGGLTLLNTQNTDVLGEYREHLGHLSFKVKHDGLEHTLTRDNVLQDDNWDRAMKGVMRARVELRDALTKRAVLAVEKGEAIGTWHGHLAAEARTPSSKAMVERLQDQAIFRSSDGDPLTLKRIREQEGRVRGVLMAEGASPLNDALRQIGLVLVEDHPETRALLLATEEPPMFESWRGRRQLRRADEVFVLPALVDETTLDPMERRLLARSESLLRAAVGVRVRVPATHRMLRWEPSKGSLVNRLTVRVGDFSGMDLGRSEVLALNGPTNGSVFKRPEPSWFRLPAFLTWRSLLVNRHHPLFRAQLLASAEDLEVAAFGLATALLHCEGLEGDGAYDRMLAVVTEQLGKGP